MNKILIELDIRAHTQETIGRKAHHCALLAQREEGERRVETHQLELHVFDLGKLGEVEEKEEKNTHGHS